MTTRTLLCSLHVASLALGCKREGDDTGDTDDTDTGDTDTGDTSDTDTGDTDTSDTDTGDTGTTFTCPADDTNEPDDDAANANSLTATTAGQVCADDADWFSFVAGPQCLITFTLDFAHADGDIDLYLYDDQEDVIDGSTSTNDDEEITFDAGPDGQTVYLSVESGVTGAEAPYSLSFTQDCTPSSCVDDHPEPNDSPTDPAALTEDVVTNGEICRYDEDWYEITLNAGCPIEATLDPANGNDLDLLLLDPDLFLYGQSASLADPEVIEYDHLAPTGSMFLVVLGYERAEDTYTLNVHEDTANCVSPVACTDDGEEPDDDAGTANELEPGGSYHGQICQFNYDWYEVRVNTGCTGAFQLDFDTQLADLDLYLYDEDGALVDYSTNFADIETLSYDNNAGTTDAVLYLKAAGYLDALGEYDITYEATCGPCVDDAEDNDTYQTATDLGASFDGHICLGDEDWFKFEVQDGCEVRVELDWPTFDDFDMYLWDDPLEQYPLNAFTPFGATEEVPEFIPYSYYAPEPAPPDGLHYLRVFGYGESDEGAYALTLTSDCAVCEDDAAEAADGNDDSDHPTVLDPPPDEFIGAVCHADEDWFELAVGEGCEVTVTLDIDGEDTAVEGDLEMLLFDDPLQDPIAEGATLDDPEQIVHLNEGGDVTWLLQVVGYLGPVGFGDEGGYTLDYSEVCAPVCDVPNDDDTGPDATPLTLTDTEQPLPGQVCAGGDQDWFSFSLDPACTLELELEIVTEAEDLDMYLYATDSPASELDDVTFDLLLGWEGATESDPEVIRYQNPDDSALSLWLQALGYDGGASDYTLTYSESCVNCTDANEDDDSDEADKPLAKDTTFEGTSCYPDEDWFSITAALGCDIDVDLVFTEDEADLDLYLYTDPQGSDPVATAIGNTTTESILYTGNPDGGAYLIRVDPYEGASPYTLVWTEVDCP